MRARLFFGAAALIFVPLARALLFLKSSMRPLFTCAFALLIGTTSAMARADAELDPTDVSIVVEDDVGLDAVDNPTADAGPLLPNGEPLPPPDLADDSGSCGCRTAGAAASLPASLALVLAALWRRRAVSERSRKQPRA